MMVCFKMKFLVFTAFAFILPACRTNKIPQFVPQGYHLDLYPDLDIKLLKGLVIINIATYAEPTSTIELDADPSVSIQYKSIKVVELAKGSRNVENKTNYEITAVERVLYDPGTLRIHLNGKLMRDVTYQVQISFETVLKNDTDESEPIYMKTYLDKTRTERKFFIMDLTRNGCYKAFPCFNKPAYKSWISLAVIRKNDFYALSSAPVNYTVPLSADKALVKDYFLSTPPLSMKSLALIVSDLVIPKPDPSFADRSNEADNTISYEIPPYALNAFTINVVIKHLEEHLLIPFPPKGFNLMVYPRAAEIPLINAYGLLILPDPPNEELYVCSLVLGIFRQWFNHMATPVSQHSIIEPILIRFTYQTSSKIMEKLGIARTNELNCDSTDFMNFVFFEDFVELTNTTSDSSKANSLFINMMDNLFESKLLNEAVHMLLRKKEFKMYSEDDIWHALSDASARLNKEFERTNYENLEQVFESWRQPGFFPLVTVQRDYQNNRINVTQEPFVYGDNEFKLLEVQQNVSYYRPRMIPAIISHPNNYFTKKEFLGWMSGQNHSFHLKFMDRFDFIVFNPSYVGSFVTNYDERNWMMLMENFNSLPGPYKLQLLFDSMVLANMNKLDYTYFLNMSLSINSDEYKFALCTKYVNTLYHLMSRFHGDVARKFKEYAFRQTLTLLHRIPSSDMNSFPKNERNLIEATKKEIKYQLNCLRNRAACFTLWEYEILMYEVRTGKSLTGDHVREIIRNISLPDWEIIANALFHGLQNNATYNGKQVLRILMCTENPVAFETLMNLIYLNFNENGFVITEDAQKVVLYDVTYFGNHDLVLKFVDKNFYVLKERLSDQIWQHLIRTLITMTKTENDSKELFNLYNKYSGQFGAADKIMREGLVIVSKRVRRDAEIYPVIENWLDFAINKFNDFT